jgi:small GTP-binding protein
MDDTSQEITLKAFKVILVGMQSVGKSSILCRLVSSQFPSSYQATVGIDYHTYSANVNNHSYSLQIWDTAGQ